ncbi:hypothetical protein PsYK624_068320 [Phanerochaete sordida]|uniref:Uncharacterized protein n=1 Tax=Phanerochaete sordida TaxID=48140 RepID=A0A9P3LDS8_9APHY|nr:hypothetical protein PsYK624_068320 [Phanerochaete sordida]
MSALQISEDHPLSLELASLRATVARYQHEAHAASVKLQRHSLDASHAIEQTHALQQENTRLREEVSVLKAHPDVAPHPAILQVSELSLALRRLSEQLTSTEATLLERTTDLTHARSDLQTAQSDSEAAHALTVQAYIQIDHEHQTQRELERRVRAAEEDRKLADLVVQEYADLVRSLEGRPAKTPPSPHAPATPASATESSASLVSSLAEGRLGLQRLLGEHHTETEKLASHITKLSDENEFLKTKLDVERKRSEADRESLAQVLLELDKQRIDDATATKMVSRYMKFSQSTIDSLQQAMENMKTRHTAAVATLNAQVEYLQKALSAERRQAEKLRNTLDELSEDINREAYGRRREVALRLSFLSREESLAENLRRWLRRSKESMDRTLLEDSEHEVKLRIVLEHVLQGAETLLESLNGQPDADGNAPASIARLVVAQEAVKSMTKELNEETERRLQLQRQLAEIGFDIPGSADGIRNFALSAPPPRTVSLGQVVKSNPSAVSSSHNAETAEVPASGVDASSTTVADAPQPQPTTSMIPSPAPLDHAPATPKEPTDTQAPIPASHSVCHSSPPLTHDLHGKPEATVDEALAVQPQITVAIADEVPAADMKPPASTETSEEAVSASATTGYSEPHTNGRSPAKDAVPLQDDARALGLDSAVVLTLNTAAPHQAQPNTAAELPRVAASVSADIVPVTVLDGTNTAATTDLSEPKSLLFSPAQTPPPPPLDSSSANDKQTLLAELNSIKSRYQHLQKAFHDCNVTLKDLKREAASLPSSHDMSSVIRTSVDRLDDYNEDARVELEIRVADEERIVTGYETLISVTGALDEEMDESKLQEDIRAFVDGSDRAVTRAMTQFSRKLDDLQHDIASIKKALYEITADDAARPTTPTKNASWSTWTAGILGTSAPSRPVSPAPSFGTVMTSPRQRQASFSLARRPSTPLLAHGRTPSDDGADPFASLGLRIPMPVHVMPAPALPKTGTFLSSMSMGTPLRPGPKQRASSASLFALGLGARGSTFSFAQSPSRMPSSSALGKQEEVKEVDSKEASGDESDSDIE